MQQIFIFLSVFENFAVSVKKWPKITKILTKTTIFSKIPQYQKYLKGTSICKSKPKFVLIEKEAVKNIINLKNVFKMYYNIIVYPNSDVRNWVHLKTATQKWKWVANIMLQVSCCDFFVFYTL